MASLPVSSDTAFQFEGRNVRLVEQDGETWFVAADVARELGYGLASDLIKNLDADEKGMCPVHTLGGGQAVSIISEAGVYRAIVQRKLNKRQHNPGLHEKVGRFQRFVFHDVLPQIRQTGGYNPAPIAPVLPKSYAEALRELAATVETVEQQRTKIATLAPKAQFHDDVANAVNSQDMESVAKVLNIGRNNLFKFLREQFVLQDCNKPYQQYLTRGYLEVIEQVWRDREQQPHTTTKTLVTGKSLIFIRKLLAEKLTSKSQTVPALPAAATAH